MRFVASRNPEATGPEVIPLPPSSTVVVMIPWVNQLTITTETRAKPELCWILAPDRQEYSNVYPKLGEGVYISVNAEFYTNTKLDDLQAIIVLRPCFNDDQHHDAELHLRSLKLLRTLSAKDVPGILAKLTRPAEFSGHTHHLIPENDDGQRAIQTHHEVESITFVLPENLSYVPIEQPYSVKTRHPALACSA